MTLPDWNSIHPLIVHFPVALLLTAPVLILIGLVLQRQRGFLHAALVMMALGTIGAWVAVESGEAAGRLAERSDQIEGVLDRHSDMAETTATIFTVLTGVYAVVLFAPAAFRRRLPRVAEAGSLAVFLVAYAAGALYLARTAEQGGALVHRYGIHAVQGPAAASLPGEGKESDHDDD